MRAMPRLPAGSDGCRDPGPAGVPATGIRGRRSARGIARVARSYAEPMTDTALFMRMLDSAIPT